MLVTTTRERTSCSSGMLGRKEGLGVRVALVTRVKALPIVVGWGTSEFSFQVW